MDTTLTPIRGNVLHFTKTVGFPKHVTLPLPRNAFKAVSRRTIGRKREDDALRENFTTFRRISQKHLFNSLKYLKGPPSIMFGIDKMSNESPRASTD